MAFQHNAFQHNAFQGGPGGGAAAPDPFRFVDAPRRSFRQRLYDTTASANLALGIPVLVPRQPIFQVRPEFVARPDSEVIVSSIALTATPAADPFKAAEETRVRRQIATLHSEATRGLALDEGALIPFRLVEQGKLPKLAGPERSEVVRSLALDPMGAAPFTVREDKRLSQVPVRPRSEIVVSLALTEVPAADPFRSDDAASPARFQRGVMARLRGLDMIGNLAIGAGPPAVVTRIDAPLTRLHVGQMLR